MFGNAKVRTLAGALIACALLCLSSTTLLAQGTGQISGRVYDSKTNQPLGYANIVIVGSTKGAMSLDDGNFNVTGVPVGTHTVKVMMMGYKTIERPGVVVNANETTELSFPLEQTIVATTQVINVVGEREMVDVTSSDVRSSVTEEQVKEMPVDDVVDAVALKTGIVKTGDELHARGGRSGEIQMQIDGVPVDDPLGAGAIGVGMLGTQGSDFIAGGMDAEYGNAQSGVINIQTKEGGPVFGGEFRYFTDDFGRQDKTYTNFDRVSLGLGGPTPWRSVRYYVSAEATFLDGENNTVEPREEHKVTEWLKWRDRMSHSYNLQTKVSWNKAPFKVTGEAILQKSTYDTYEHNWNIKGYVQKVYLFQRLRPTQSGVDVFEFGNIWSQYEGQWLQDVNNPNKQPNPRFVIVEKLVRDPETNEQELITFYNFRGVDIPIPGRQDPITILWDEAILDANDQIVGFRPWVLFEGFQFPQSRFSNFKDDTSYVFFNSASRTPQIKNTNLQLKFGFNHNISDDLLYTINVSRVEFNQKQTVDGKAPAEYSTAGTPTIMPDGTLLQGGVSQAVWYTDEDNPYFITAYDYPFYRDRQSVTWLLKSDLTSERIKGHRMKTGFQLIYNDLDQDDRIEPGRTRINPSEGTIQQGRNVNQFHNFNPEAAFYVQDKWEYEGMVVNAGARIEYFSTGNNDQIRIRSGEVDPTVDVNKFNWSPRLGFAFPITDRDKFFFHYGRFTQWPSHSYLFATQDAIGTFGTLGNPNLGEELTVSYQAGISHQFTEDIAGNFVVFSKDIYGLVSSTRVTDDSTNIQSIRFINRTYASSRGLEISLEKRLTRHFGFEAYYTYSFADGVASDADFGRSAEGLTHLPTDELPLNWDQRHTFNLTFRLQDRNNWGATAIYSYGSGLPWTPVDRFARLQDPTWENSRRLPATHRLSIQGRKKFSIYGRELTLFFEGRNLLDEDILVPNGDAPTVFPNMVVAGMDGGSYLTETGRFGGAYLLDIDDDGRDDFIPVNDPTVFEQHRIWRIGFGFEF
ncbi:MAG: carboxypeptidase-like regulatory domain-containing protein [Candidatus Latescibacterota bacterium]|nr:MAG: carboxypeptidase-like regulatory domain-containing protein [Candidatus Latescibacterota bacterium]